MEKIKSIVLLPFLCLVYFAQMAFASEFVEVETASQKVSIYAACGGRVWSWQVNGSELVKRDYSQRDKAGLFADRFSKPESMKSNRELDREPYQLLSKREVPEGIEISLGRSYNEAGLQGLYLEKVYLIFNDKPKIETTYIFNNKGKDEINFSFWIHSMADLGKEANFAVPGDNGINLTTLKDGVDLLFLPAGMDGDEACWNLHQTGTVCENWAVEYTEGKCLVSNFELNKLADLYFYQSNPPTFEWIYRMAYLKPGDTWGTSVSLAYSERTVEEIAKERNSLIGLWRFDESEGNIAKDTSPLANHAVIHNAAWCKGRSGHALQFGGSKGKSWIELPLHEAMPNEFTMMAWVYLEDLNRANTLFSRWHWDKGERSFSFRIGQGGRPIYATSSTGVASGAGVSSFKAVEQNRWHHIALAQKGKIAKVFVDGEEAGTGLVDIPFPNKRSITLGVQSDIFSDFLQGMVDDVRIYKEAMNSDKICRIAGITAAKAPAGPMVGYFPLNERKGNKIKDGIGGLEGRAVGCMWQEENLFLNGLDSYILVPSKDYLNFKDTFTISAWIFLKDIKGKQVIVSKGQDIAKDAYGYNFLQENGKLGLRAFVDIKTDNNWRKIYQVFSDNPCLKPNEWMFVACTYSMQDKKIRLFVDGKKVKESDTVGEVIYEGGALPLVIGANAAQTQSWELLGSIKEIKLYNVALPELEISKEYTQSAVMINKEWKKTRPEIKAKVYDEITKKPLPVRVMIKGSDGRYYFQTGSFAYGDQNKNWFYSFGEFDLEIPAGNAEIMILAGPEYEAKKVQLSLQEKETKTVNIAMKRFIDMPKKGWYSGDHEVQYVGHSRGYGKYDDLYHGKEGALNAANVCRAEGLSWVVYSHGSAQDKAYEMTTDNFISFCGAETATWLDDDIICINMRKGAYEESNRVFNLQTLEYLSRQEPGSIGICAHPYIGDFWNVANKEYSRCFPIYIALGKCAPILNSSLTNKEEEGYYRLLNLGFKIGLSGSTDSYIGNPFRSGIVGSSRTYVKAKEFTRSQIIEGLSRGRTVVSSGPIISFTLAGKEIGDTVKLIGKKKETLSLHLEAYFYPGLENIEVIKNGNLVKRFVGEGRQRIEEELPIEIDETCWVAVKCSGYLGTAAHTSPIYVQFGEEAKKVNKEDIDYFVKWLDDLSVFIEAFKKTFPDRIKGNEGHFLKLEETRKTARNIYLSLGDSPRKYSNEGY